MSHVWFRIVCSCGARMHGETDGPYDVLYSIFTEGHKGHRTNSAVAYTRDEAKSMPTLAELAKRP